MDQLFALPSGDMSDLTYRLERAMFFEDTPSSERKKINIHNSIFESWKRSRDFKVKPAKSEIEWIETDPEHTLIRHSREPIKHLIGALHGLNIGIVIAENTSRILARYDVNAKAGSILDEIYLSPGFNYSEDSVGTNGIGTVIETSRPIYVRGTAHYQERFDNYACAGAPIKHPTTGELLGVLDLTSDLATASPFLLRLAQQTSSHIAHALKESSWSNEKETLNVFLSDRVGSSKTSLTGKSRQEVSGSQTKVTPKLETSSWKLAKRELQALLKAERSVVLIGEDGAGKKTLVKETITAAGTNKDLIEVNAGKEELRSALEEKLKKYKETRNAVFVLMSDIQNSSRKQLQEISFLLRNPILSGLRLNIVLTSDSKRTDSRDLKAVLPYVHSMVSLAPLRERQEDISVLVQHFLKEKHSTDTMTISPEALDTVQKGGWFGNIKQLEKSVAEAVKSARYRGSKTLTVSDFSSDTFYSGRKRFSPIELQERETILCALSEYKQNRTAAAKFLGVSRATLYRKIKLYGI